LYERPHASRPGWINLKLVATGQNRRKRNWWFGWNGERLAQGKDTKLLQEYQPEIFQWVVNILKVTP
jgi:hypothetical protein